MTFPKRSLPWLFTNAALGGLKPAPVSRLRGARPHLLHSYAHFIQSALVAHNNDDIENIIDSAKYKIFRSILKSYDKPDRLIQKARSLFSEIVHFISEIFKKLVKPINV